jgi:hypothetical protein
MSPDERARRRREQAVIDHLAEKVFEPARRMQKPVNRQRSAGGRTGPEAVEPTEGGTAGIRP